MALMEAAVAVISSSWVHLRLVVVHLEAPCFSLGGCLYLELGVSEMAKCWRSAWLEEEI